MNHSMPARSARSQRGSVLLVAMLLGAVLAISLGSFIALNTQSQTLAHRSFYLSEAMNMAESGLEEAVWSFNRAQAGDPNAWDGWNTTDGLTARRTFTDFSLGAHASGVVKVYVERFDPPANVPPKVAAFATVTLPGTSNVITKMVEVRMRRRSYFATGLVAKDNMTFSGNNVSVDSWISNPDSDPTTPAVPYSPAVRRDKGSIGGASITSTLSIGNADIWGTASVGGSTTAAITVGSNGIVGPFGTGSGTKNPASLATDFSANLETLTNPAGGTALASLAATLGTAGTPTVWRTPSISNSLTVYGDVTLVLTAPAGLSAIDLTGTEGITLAAGATLTIYTAGDVKIAGNGLLNPNSAPETFQLWGTSTSPAAQDIQIAGNGALKGIIYAPNAFIKINGNGDVMGAVVGKEVNLTGNAAFHYDESLAGWSKNSPYGVSRWRELVTPVERLPYSAALATF